MSDIEDGVLTAATFEEWRGFRIKRMFVIMLMMILIVIDTMIARVIMY